MNIFISGGCKNGKSTYAEQIASWLSEAAKPLYYIATMLPADDEDKKRIERHRYNRRNLGFTTIEHARDLREITTSHDRGGTYLLDSATALLANEMFGHDGTYNPEAGKKVASDIAAVMGELNNLVVVSDYIYSDARFYDDMSENYRSALALVDRTCAKSADVVLEVCYGCLFIYKGEGLLKPLLNKSGQGLTFFKSPATNIKEKI